MNKLWYFETYIYTCIELLIHLCDRRMEFFQVMYIINTCDIGKKKTYVYKIADSSIGYRDEGYLCDMYDRYM